MSTQTVHRRPRVVRQQKSMIITKKWKSGCTRQKREENGLKAEFCGQMNLLSNYRGPGERFSEKCTVATVENSGGKIMVWGTMARSGIGNLTVVKG